jgi:hypothetical protein
MMLEDEENDSDDGPIIILTTITTNTNNHIGRLVSLGIGVVSKHTGRVEHFIPSPRCRHHALPPRGDTVSLEQDEEDEEDEEITATTTTLLEQVSDITTTPAPPPPSTATRFLRTADLLRTAKMTTTRTTTGVDDDVDTDDNDDDGGNEELDDPENWVGLDDGRGGPSSLAKTAVQALFVHGKHILLNQNLWTAADAKTHRETTMTMTSITTTTSTTASTGVSSSCWKTTTFQERSYSSSPLKISGSVLDHHHDHSIDVSDETILIWSGQFNHRGGGGYGHDIPAIRSSALIRTSALSLVELLVDSNRVREYNALSLGRIDDLVLADDDDDNNNDTADADDNVGFGLCTKLMTSQTKPPLIRKILTFTSLLHARHDVDGDGSYYLVTRGIVVVDPTAGPHGGNSGGSEILLGVNRIQPVTNDCCLLTSVNHVKSSLVPMMIAKRIGLQAAANFVHDLRKCGT